MGVCSWNGSIKRLIKSQMADSIEYAASVEAMDVGAAGGALRVTLTCDTEDPGGPVDASVKSTVLRRVDGETA